MTDKISPEDFQRIYKVVEEKGGIVLAICLLYTSDAADE